MTYDDFKAKHKENVLKGFDDLDGKDYWAEFKADLHILLADERKPLELQLNEVTKQLSENAKDYHAGLTAAIEKSAALTLQVGELQNGMTQIVGVCQGSMGDEASFNAIYDIAKGLMEKGQVLLCLTCGKGHSKEVNCAEKRIDATAGRGCPQCVPARAPAEWCDSSNRCR